MIDSGRLATQMDKQAQSGAQKRYPAGRSPRSTCQQIAYALVILILSQLPGHSFDTHLQQSLQLLDRGDLDGAANEANLALSDPPSRPLAYATMGVIRLKQKRYAESTQLLRKAVQLDPNLVGARLNLGYVYALQGHRDRAREAFQEVLKRDAKNFDARFALVRIENESGNYKASQAAAEPILPRVMTSEEGILLLASNYACLCFWQLLLAHFGGLIWPTLGRCGFGEAF